MNDPVILDSARKHGVDDDDMLHAIRNPIRIVEQSDDVLMYIGAGSDGALFEVGVITTADGIELVIHAMACRHKYLPKG